ncbi:hypothetical protein HanXRQr2_Chr11g0476661 [Helianthus annuus]|uniref:Uncharacterized protein n=1 Tax=Helianthus annuus TaxID=4232 RepID=A0A9K3HMB4_HELAN|nr:hypothetical protein HanXRQr2_Chr11g0476661 [Helianthus annuus]KAJ0874036.1 hypothetical protein HanPSC8_Chr11g0459431 [Helianthus annuus]
MKEYKIREEELMRIYIYSIEFCRCDCVKRERRRKNIIIPAADCFEREKVTLD